VRFCAASNRARRFVRQTRTIRMDGINRKAPEPILTLGFLLH
jgi:hypothetical protein